ncbi:hypothetical protein TCON_0682 [Astathelohania contejeani]|uniref:Uncharacterized protein n=1 Tax=Astathelohania contejeani TaxID=164912 RepID=A0ABQ7I172_9MICR|nr:hypothetical protein TCON_0682 [Thelohania contejeani]
MNHLIDLIITYNFSPMEQKNIVDDLYKTVKIYLKLAKKKRAKYLEELKLLENRSLNSEEIYNIKGEKWNSVTNDVMEEDKKKLDNVSGNFNGNLYTKYDIF